MSKHHTTSPHDIEANNVVPSSQPSVDHRPRLLRNIVLDAAKLVQPPRKAQQVIRRLSKVGPVSIEEFNRQRLRLPYGQWITDDGAVYLFNYDFELLLIWPAGAERPDYCDLGWGDITVQEGDFFYSNRSIYDIGPSNLHHALEAVIDTWKRGDRDTAEVLTEWLVCQNKAFQELIRACQKERT